MKNRIVTILIATLSLASLLAGCSSASKALTPGQPVEVKRGDLDVTVSTDGNLSMPNEYDLKFGTAGQVTQILVNEGDFVRQGALLAMLDSSTQINAIKSALFSIQTAQNSLTIQTPTGCYLPYNFPDLSLARMADEAQTDINTAVDYYRQGDYKDAGYRLVMTYFDIEVCQNLIQTRPNAAELAGAKSNSIYYPDPYAGSSVSLSENNQQVIDYLGKYQDKLLNISNDLKSGDYAKATPEFDAVSQEITDVAQAAKSTMAIHSRMIYEYADTPTSADFLQSSLRAVQDLQSYLASDNALPVEAAKQLYTANLNLLVGRDVLQTQTLIFETGGNINWQTMQQYNISLQAAEISLYQRKQDIMQTVIIAPSDGTVVEVDLKISYVTSAQNYSSSTAIKLVDTSYVRFSGQVDEIDIMKVSAGQKATITVDAVANKEYTGTVKFISPFGALTGQVIKFTVFITLDHTDASLKGGLSATATIATSSVKNALLIPVSVITTTTGGPVVMVLNEKTGVPERTRITIGIQNLQYAEVLSGLQEGEKVVVVPQGTSSPRTQQPAGNAAFRALR